MAGAGGLFANGYDFDFPVGGNAVHCCVSILPNTLWTASSTNGESVTFFRFAPSSIARLNSADASTRILRFSREVGFCCADRDGDGNDLTLTVVMQL